MIVALTEMRTLNCLVTAMDLFVIKGNFIHSFTVVKSGHGHHFENGKIITKKKILCTIFLTNFAYL